MFLKEGKLVVSEFETCEEEIVDYFTEIKPEEREERFKSSLKMGVSALKAIGTTEKVDYIQKEFGKLDQKFEKALEDTSKEVSDYVQSVLGENGTLPTVLAENFGENGKLDSIMQTHFGEKGTFADLLEKHFGKDGMVIKELLSPTKEGTPLNQLRQFFTEEITRLRKDIGIKEETDK